MKLLVDNQLPVALARYLSANPQGPIALGLSFHRYASSDCARCVAGLPQAQADAAAITALNAPLGRMMAVTLAVSAR